MRLKEYINSNRISDEELFALAAIGYGIDQDHEEFLAKVESKYFKVYMSSSSEQTKLDLERNMNFRVKITPQNAQSSPQSNIMILESSGENR